MQKNRQNKWFCEGTAQTCHSDMVRRRFPTSTQLSRNEHRCDTAKEIKHLVYAVPQKFFGRSVYLQYKGNSRMYDRAQE